MPFFAPYRSFPRYRNRSPRPGDPAHHKRGDKSGYQNGPGKTGQTAEDEMRMAFSRRCIIYWLAQRIRAIHSISFGFKDAIGMLGIERMKLNGSGCLPVQYLGHHFSVPGSHQHAVALAHCRIGCNDKRIAVTVKGQHGLARNFQRIYPFPPCGPEIPQRPSPARQENRHRRNSRPPPASAMPSSGIGCGSCVYSPRCRGRLSTPAMRRVNSSKVAPVASITLASDSAEGQRARRQQRNAWTCWKVVGILARHGAQARRHSRSGAPPMRLSPPRRSREKT